jgi:hypothetical protein
MLHGLFLPSLRPFVLTSLPRDPASRFGGSPHTIVLSSRRLYVIENGSEKLYAAPIPTAPPTRR